MAMHVFVAMPYGVKEGIDFNAVYDEYIKPALEGEGFEVFRADEEFRAGSIHKDMFQELLLADLVVRSVPSKKQSQCFAFCAQGTDDELRDALFSKQAGLS